MDFIVFSISPGRLLQRPGPGGCNHLGQFQPNSLVFVSLMKCRGYGDTSRDLPRETSREATLHSRRYSRPVAILVKYPLLFSVMEESQRPCIERELAAILESDEFLTSPSQRRLLE